MSHILCCARALDDDNTDWLAKGFDGNVYKYPPDQGASCEANTAVAGVRCQAEGCASKESAAVTLAGDEPISLCLRHWETHRQGSTIWVMLRAGEPEGRVHDHMHPAITPYRHEHGPEGA